MRQGALRGSSGWGHHPLAILEYLADQCSSTLTISPNEVIECVEPSSRTGDQCALGMSVNPAIQKSRFASGVRIQRRDERLSLLQPDAVKVQRDAKLQEVLADPAVLP